MKSTTSPSVSLGLIAGVLLLGASSSFAAGETSAQFLKLGAGARQAAMGEAGATTRDVTAGYWNPAGLSYVETPEAAFMQTSFLEDTQYQYAGGVLPMGKHAFGLTLQRMDFGTFDSYSVADAKTGSFDASSFAGSLNYAFEWSETLRFGGSAKLIQESIENESGSAFALDFGLHTLLKRFNLGISAHNVGSKIKFVQDEEDLPMIIRAGAETSFLEDRLVAILDISKAKDNDPTIHAGAEFFLREAVALRGGYQVTPGNSLDVDGLTNLTGGIGLQLGQFNLDYAFLPFGDLGDTHRFSVKYVWSAR